MHENIIRESGFSNSSSDYFYQFLREQKGACLFNKPQHKGCSRRHSHCGDGVVEDQEQCDCGSACDNHPCCDNTCRLKANAECNPGPCCNLSCQYEPKGHNCHAGVGECNLPEYCDGTSDACPAHSYKQDSTLCQKTHYCVDGHCRSPDNLVHRFSGAQQGLLQKTLILP